MMEITTCMVLKALHPGKKVFLYQFMKELCKLHMGRTISVWYSVISTVLSIVPLLIQISSKGWMDKQKIYRGLVQYSHKNRLNEDWAISLLPGYTEVRYRHNYCCTDKVVLEGQGCSLDGNANLRSHLRTGKSRSLWFAISIKASYSEEHSFKRNAFIPSRILGVLFFFFSSLKHNKLVRVSMVNMGHHGNW